MSLTIAALGVAVLIAEIALRLAGFSYVIFERPDMVRGVSLTPGLSGWQTLEGKAYVTINSHGYHDRERETTKPAGIYRIAVIGDSFVEARQLPLEHAFWTQLERRLNERKLFQDKAVEVLGFGVSGHGTAQELLMLRQDVLRFSPDHVLLAFFPGNDVNDNSKALSHFSHTTPYFVLQGETLVIDNGFRETAAFRDRFSTRARTFYATQKYFRLVQLIYRIRGDATEFFRESILGEEPYFEPGLPNFVYKEPIDQVWEEAWRVTERLIREIAGETNRRGIKFGVVTLSTPLQTDLDVTRRRRVQEQLAVGDLFYPDHRIRKLGDEAGFPVLNLGVLFQEHADRHQVHLHGFPNTRPSFGHWNELGHRLAATLIAQWMEDTPSAWKE